METTRDNDSGVVYVWAPELDNTHAPPFFWHACLLNGHQNHSQQQQKINAKICFLTSLHN